MRQNPLALILAATLAPTTAGADTAVPVSRFAWQTDLIIGLSGIELDETGTKATLIGDRGYWAEATIQ